MWGDVLLLPPLYTIKRQKYSPLLLIQMSYCPHCHHLPRMNYSCPPLAAPRVLQCSVAVGSTPQGLQQRGLRLRGHQPQGLQLQGLRLRGLENGHLGQVGQVGGFERDQRAGAWPSLPLPLPLPALPHRRPPWHPWLLQQPPLSPRLDAAQWLPLGAREGHVSSVQQ